MRRHASAGRVSRQSVSDRSRPGLRRQLSTAQKVSLEALDRAARRKRCPHAAAVPDEHVRRHRQRRGRQDPHRSQDGHAANRPASSKKDEIAKLHAAMRNVNLRRADDARCCATPTACRCSFSTAACAITQIGDRHQLAALRPDRNRAASCRSGPVTIMVHMASVWVPFTSESKEAIAGYPEIQKELRLGLQAVGRKLGMYLSRRHEGEAGRRAAQHLPALPGRSGHGRQRDQRYDENKKTLYEQAAGGRQDERPPKPT